MYSDISILQKRKVIDKKCAMPPILAIGMLIAIVSFVLIARGLFHMSYEEISVSAQSNNIVIFRDTELNTSEREILTMLSNVFNMSEQEDQGNRMDYLYYKTLHDYLSSSEVSLSSTQALSIKDKISDIQGIINFEAKTKVGEMSLDGRKVVIYLSEQIYELCGLKLVLTMEGAIKQISDPSGNMIYINNASTSAVEFQVNVLLITLSFLLTLFGICVIIAKKNQLFMKEVEYDGFDEERFA